MPARIPEPCSSPGLVSRGQATALRHGLNTGNLPKTAWFPDAATGQMNAGHWTPRRLRMVFPTLSVRLSNMVVNKQKNGLKRIASSVSNYFEEKNWLILFALIEGKRG